MADMTTKRAALDLDALVNVARLPRVRLGDAEYTVRPITAAQAHRVAQLNEADGVAVLEAMLDLVRACVPELPAATVEALSVEQLAALVQLARGQVEEVERMIQEQAEKNG